MKEIICIRLENEMDLILANKRTMKLAEMCGLSLIIQTGLATAVSEIARCALSENKNASLKLGITCSPNKKNIAAIVCNTTQTCGNTDAIGFAKRLITDVSVINAKGASCDIQLTQDLKSSGPMTEAKIESFVEYFTTEPPLSPYDEIRRKNIQLLEFSRKLKESEDQYRRLAETLPLMMFTTDPEGEILYTNRWFKNYLGTALTTITTVLGQSVIHSDDYSATQKNWSVAFNRGGPFCAQGRLKNVKDNTYLWHLISILPVKDENNTVTQWTGFFVDINAQKIIEDTLKDNVELKEAQKNLLEYQKQLEEKINELNISNNELEQFAYIASHDLQEPLRKIATFSTILADRLPELDAESGRYFKKIISSSDRMREQIQGVLEWSRVGKTKDEFSPVNLNAIIQRVKSDLQPEFHQKKVIIETSILPTVKAVPLQMTQLFANLISNAVKFCNTVPRIKICARDLGKGEMSNYKMLDTAASYSEVIVSDNGIGFDPEYSEQIFKIFKRLNGNGLYEGTGIGLAICKRIVENHKGQISANAIPGFGATFTIILPH